MREVGDVVVGADWLGTMLLGCLPDAWGGAFHFLFGALERSCWQRRRTEPSADARASRSLSTRGQGPSETRAAA